MSKQDKYLEFPKGKASEFFYLLISIFIYIFIMIKGSSLTADKKFFSAIELQIPFILFGIVNLICSNIMAFYYNLARLMIPLGPKATPFGVKILGCIILIIATFIIVAS